MRLTYSNIISAHFRNIGKAGQETDTNLLADFNYSLGNRYQLILSNISSYINQTPRTSTTVASSKYSTGTALCTNGSTTVTGTDTVWTASMVGSLFAITDTTVSGHFHWYTVAAFVSVTEITLSESWKAATCATSTYSIETPEYYSYPPGIVDMDDISITISGVNYPLTPIYDQSTWNELNSIQIQASAIPQFYFPRKDDFGIWPIPTGAYKISYYTFDRDRNLLVADYTGGTALCTYLDATVTGTSTTWTAAMVGRWFTITDTTAAGQGYWYRVKSFTSATSIELNRPWVADTIATSTYRIGESPEIPGEAHILLADGTAADFYSGLRTDIDKATWWENKFYTGSGNDRRREGADIKAGLIGLINRYKSRDRSSLIYRGDNSPQPNKLFATTLS